MKLNASRGAGNRGAREANEMRGQSFVSGDREDDQEGNDEYSKSTDPFSLPFEEWPVLLLAQNACDEGSRKCPYDLATRRKSLVVLKMRGVPRLDRWRRRDRLRCAERRTHRVTLFALAPLRSTAFAMANVRAVDLGVELRKYRDGIAPSQMLYFGTARNDPQPLESRIRYEGSNRQGLRQYHERQRRRCPRCHRPSVLNPRKRYERELQNHGSSEQTGKPVSSAYDSAASSESTMEVAWMVYFKSAWEPGGTKEKCHAAREIKQEQRPTMGYRRSHYSTRAGRCHTRALISVPGIFESQATETLLDSRIGQGRNGGMNATGKPDSELSMVENVVRGRCQLSKSWLTRAGAHLVIPDTPNAWITVRNSEEYGRERPKVEV
ncbi:hypothetical protein B0H11DRAFT_1941155 [Mycena galericulata]|nr:hypothetical protein B0H11DRAFT_1941155 [Mycena galericulata]